MSLRILLLGVLLLHIGSVAVAGSRRLEGCPEPDDIASALAKLRERGWTAWTPEELAKAWPRPLRPLDCESNQGTCLVLGHKGRGGDQSCECCETFDFLADRGREGQERLSGVILFYSAERYVDALAAARLLAKAMSLPDREGPVGPEQQPPPGETIVQHFEWKETSLEQGAILDLQMSHERSWTVYLAVGWHPVD